MGPMALGGRPPITVASHHGLWRPLRAAPPCPPDCGSPPATRQLNGAKGTAKLQISGELGRISCALLGALLADNTCLEALSLGGTALGSDGGAVFEHLAPNQTNPLSALRTLDLSRIELGERGGMQPRANQADHDIGACAHAPRRMHAP